jgi:copper chaperone
MEHLLTVSGMTCGHCERAITQALLQIDRASSSVRVGSEQPRAKLAQAIAEEGYQVAPT